MDLSRLTLARGAVLGAVAAAVVMNVAQFPVIERDIGRTYAAFNRYPTSDVVDVVAAHTPTVRERFGLYMDLRHWARGAEVFIGRSTGLQRDHLAGLSDMGELRLWDSDHALTDDEAARIVGHVVAEGEDRWAGPFTISLFDRNAARLVAFRDDDTLRLVDERLLEGFEP